MTRREQILAQAAGLFASHGFHGVSVADIGAACGISGPALYKHFPSKDAMLAEMLVSVSEMLLAEGEARVREAADAAEALEALIAFHVDFALGARALIVVQDRDFAALPAAAGAEVRRLQRAYIQLWADQLRQLDPVLDGKSAFAKAQAGFGLMNATPRSGEIGDEELKALLSAMAYAALVAPTG